MWRRRLSNQSTEESGSQDGAEAPQPQPAGGFSSGSAVLELWASTVEEEAVMGPLLLLAASDEDGVREDAGAALEEWVEEELSAAVLLEVAWLLEGLALLESAREEEVGALLEVVMAALLEDDAAALDDGVALLEGGALEELELAEQRPSVWAAGMLVASPGRVIPVVMGGGGLL